MDNLWMLNLVNISEIEKADTKFKSCKWSLIETTGKSPGALSYHSSVVIGDTMYLYGGSS
jgi:hypothetical protein